MTVLSLLQTLILWALSRRWFLAPPPHRLSLLGRAASKFLLGSQASKETHESDLDVLPARNPAQQTGEESVADNKQEWRQIFTTLHIVLSILVSVVYILGIIIIQNAY